MNPSGTTSIIIVVLAVQASAADFVVQPGQSIQSAIDAAANGDRVLVHAGTYFEAIDLRGKDLEVLGVDGAESTVIDGTGFGTSTVTMDRGEPESCRFAGFTVVGGVGKPVPPFDLGWVGGGGIHVAGSSVPRIEDCVVRNNTANFGGGVYYGGGGLATAGDPDRIKRCRFIDNQAVGPSSGGGGYYGTAGLVDCRIEANSSEQNAGGAFAARMRGCIVRGNSATNLGGGAVGGVAPNTASTLFIACRFEGNSAKFGAGVARSVKFVPFPMILDGCHIIGNTGFVASALISLNETIGGFGGAWDEYRRCVIAGNVSTSSAVDIVLDTKSFASPGPTIVSRCTIVGDAVELRQPVAFDNTIFADVPAPIALGSEHATFDHCLAPVALPGAGNVIGQPAFIDASNDDFHLTAGSPGVDVGSSTLDDFEGDPIFLAPDIGADEFHPHIYALGTASPNSLLQFVAVSPPGTPSLLFASTTLADAPITTPFGPWWLGTPLAAGSPILLPPNHGSGFVRFDLRLPPSVVGGDAFHAQALTLLAPPKWTNVLSIHVEE